MSKANTSSANTSSQDGSWMSLVFLQRVFLFLWDYPQFLRTKGTYVADARPNFRVVLVGVHVLGLVIARFQRRTPVALGIMVVFWSLRFVLFLLLGLIRKLPRWCPKAKEEKNNNKTSCPNPSKKNPIIAFGASDWKKYFGTHVGPEPPLPSRIHEILDEPCPFWTAPQHDYRQSLSWWWSWIQRTILGGRISSTKTIPSRTYPRIRDTHVLTLVPTHVNGIPFSLNVLDSLVRNPKNGGHPTKIFVHPHVKKQLFSALVQESHWILLTKDVLPHSRQNREEYSLESFQQRRWQGGGGGFFRTQKDEESYDYPDCIDTITSVLTHYVRSRVCLYPRVPRKTLTPCTRTPTTASSSKDHHERSFVVLVGRFDPRGLDVDVYNPNYDRCAPKNRTVNRPYYPYDCSSVGLAACRRFYGTSKHPTICGR